MAGPPFVFDHDPVYGELVDVSPLVRRMTAKNPSHFTYLGTGTYVVGRGDVAVIDPGPSDQKHIDALVKSLDGETITQIFVTHTHSDHSPGTALLLEHCDATVLAFDPSVVKAPPENWFGTFFDAFPDPEPDTDGEPSDAEQSDGQQSDGGGDDESAHDIERETIEMDFSPDVMLEHGQQVQGSGWTIEALHTPGHISNHLCFGLAEENGVFTGDHIMGWSTTVIPAPDGSLTEYMASLDVLLARPDDTVYWPTHGPPITDPQTFVAALRDHRNSRTQQILTCLDDDISSVRGMVDRMYADKPQKLHKAAALSVLSHLLHLANVGQVTTRSGELKPAEEWILTEAGR